MCVAFTSNAENHELSLFGLDGEAWDFGLVRPTDKVPIIVLDVEDYRRSDLTWGFQSLDRSARQPIVNARAETIFELPTFRDCVKSHRCVIPLRTFYEWEDTGTRKKRPWRFKHPDDALIFVAGIWKPSEQAFCMVTTAPSGVVSEVHDRMPAILSSAETDDWIRQGPRALLAPHDLGLVRDEHDPLKKPTPNLFDF